VILWFLASHLIYSQVTPRNTTGVISIYMMLITLFPGIDILTFILPKIHRLFNNIWGGLIFSISGSIVWIFASSQANTLLWTTFQFNPKYLPLTHTFLAVMIAIPDWLTIILVIILLILLIWEVFRRIKNFFSDNTYMPQVKDIKISRIFNGRDNPLIGLMFWIVLLSSVSSVVNENFIYTPRFAKFSALILDYKTRHAISLHGCSIKTVSKNTKFLWIDESRRIFSIYQPSPESQFKLGKFKTMTCYS